MTSDKSDNLLKTSEDVVKAWFNFLMAKFAVTEAESNRDPLEALPTKHTAADSLTPSTGD